jgi:acyl transferase domain-containing protein/NAD(P)H-dependent flavin oxidoreductase YrpB (nitropropane dioxygenase family)/NADP-dependent 3-hydroxy acid dehydrogenase YdfG
MSPVPSIIAITPFEHPDARLALALARAGALAVLDLGRDERAGREALAKLARDGRSGLAARVPEGAAWSPSDLPACVGTVVLTSTAEVARWRPRKVIVQVTSLEEARAAERAGADALIAKGAESGGRIGAETAFVLLQRLAGAVSAPVWAQGGVGVHTAAACIVGGAAGVVLDAQLALVRESTLPDAIKAAVRSMDGSETVVIADHRLYTRPDLPGSRLAAKAAGEIVPRLGALDLERQLLPAGQDAAFARPLAEKLKTAGGVVAAIEASIGEHLRLAEEQRPLAPDSPLAQEHGLRYPIAQGPMTRVSDRAAFADAVSRGGGLPFLALALMRGDEVRELLRQTSALLGDRAWGVGILGFVPEELREEQLAVVREFRPPVALIAGGRPSQARPLDAQGTTTYLHVPSPGLLDLFLADGARRFIFEGRECGGHVGPRTSFALWEAQIERLLAHPDVGKVSVLFAGGVHDARSAAMVAAMAAPLAARGARVGVLMGTAYLFTEEAVATGAIQPGFQRAAIGCEATVLLETAPGHATRCVETEYVRAFLAEKARLEGEGKSPEEVWAALEQLNLGRLRIAAKGLRREGDRLAHVDETTQAREGMFMIGQVAVLRRGVVTVAELHRDVSEGSAAAVAEAAARRNVSPSPAEPADVAIIGMACIFPDAPDRRTFWANILAGKNAVTEVPRERWDIDLYYDPSSAGGERSRSKWGGFLPAVPFDPLAYGIPPKSITSIEPVQLLSLEVAKRALEDAGYAERPFNRDKTSVIFGAEAGTDLSSAYGFRALYPQYAGPIPPALDDHLPVLTEDSFPGVLANVIAGRIANRLDLGGVNYTVDAACAASLAALDLAVKELTTGTSDMVLCGGADLHNSINDYLLFSSVHALSPTGACRTFDADADGIVLGEGVACVVLKRLADAERDGDRIYAVIKGIAGGSDGRSLGLTAPRKEGQMRALQRAYRQSGVAPSEVGLVEAHGTGTVVGDRTELASLTEVFAGAGAAPGSVALGSVKSQIGHTKCSAGMAGLIKIALALHHRVLPPTLHIKRTNAAYDPATSPFTFGDVARPWPAETRKAGVSAFGFGGTNFHAVVAAYDGADAPASGLAEWPAELFLFRAQDRAGALRQMEKLEELCAAQTTLRLADLSRSVTERRRRGDGAVQIAIVATSREDLREKLHRARTFAVGGSSEQASAARNNGNDRGNGVFVRREGAGGQIAFLFSGQGSQRPGMLADLFIAFPGLQRFLALGPRWVSRMFPPLATTREARAAQAAALTDTRVAQPSLGIAEMALGELLRWLGVKPDMLAGHSYGELAALAHAGAIREADLLGLSEARGEHILAAAGDDPGTMAAVSAPPDAVAPHLAGLDRVVIANHNAPDQTVISGPTAGVREAVARLEAAGVAARPIPVACAFHSPLVAGAQVTLGARLAATEIEAPRQTVYSNATAAPYPRDAAEVRRMLAEHVAQPVRFVEQIEAMYAAGARIFVEVGPGRVLTGLAGKILGQRPHLAIACDQAGEPGIKQLLSALAELATSGVAIDVAPLYAGREARSFDLENPPAAKLSPSTWLVDGHLARPLDGELPPGALRPVTAPLVTPAAPALDRETAVLEYLRTTREIIEAQRQVMLGFLGDASAARPAAPEAQGHFAVPPMPSFPQSSMWQAAPASSPARLPAAPASARSGSIPPGAVTGPPSGRTPSIPPARKSAPSIPPPRSSSPSIPAPRPSSPPVPSSSPMSIAPRAAKLPAESLEWMADLGAGAGAPAPAAPPSIQEALLAIVSERTGYPVEMLDLDLNLEAELSIDSIKRIEILGTLGQKLGFMNELGEGRDKAIEKLATRKTLREIVTWLEERKAGGAGAPAPSAPQITPSIPPPSPSPVSADAPRSAVRLHRAIQRFVPAARDASGAPQAGVAGRAFVIAAEHRALAEQVIARLQAAGASARLDDGAPLAAGVGLVDLTPFAPDAAPAIDPAKGLFERALRAVSAGARSVLAVSHAGAPFGSESASPRSGAAGLIKTLAREAPGLRARSLAIDPREPLGTLAEHVVAELGTDDELLEVARTSAGRAALVMVPAERKAQGEARVELGRESVVLVTGGARGITATIARALAKRFACKLTLCGRSPLPDKPEDPELAAAADLPALRKLIIATKKAREPAAIEALASKVLAAREIRATMKDLLSAGASVDYRALDVRDAGALGALVDELYVRHGRIDGVVHGAGVLEDKLLSQKTPDSFARVFDTKVASARTLADKLRPDVGFVAFFASVSGAFGNRGQIDYSAANDALDKLAWWLSGRVKGKVVSLDWGPWAGAGMISPELSREYERRGVGLIDPALGAESFLDELLHGGSDPQVVLMNASLEVMAGGPASAPEIRLTQA